MYTTFVTDYLSQEHGHRWLTLSFRFSSRKLNDVGYLPIRAILSSVTPPRKTGARFLGVRANEMSDSFCSCMHFT